MYIAQSQKVIKHYCNDSGGYNISAIEIFEYDFKNLKLRSTACEKYYTRQ